MNKIAPKRQYPLVEITWEDSSSTTGWQKDLGNTDPLECKSAGYLVHKGKRSVVVALNSSIEPSLHKFGDTMTIPRSVVKRIRRLR